MPKHWDKEPPTLSLSSFYVSYLLLSVGFPLKWFVCPVRPHLGKNNFSFASSYQLEIVLGLDLGLVSTSSFSAVDPTGSDLYIHATIVSVSSHGISRAPGPWSRPSSSSGSQNLSTFSSRGLPEPKGRDLMESCHHGLSVPRSVTLTPCPAVCFCIQSSVLQEEASLLMVEPGSHLWV